MQHPNRLRFLIFVLPLLFSFSRADASLRVVTSITDLKNLVEMVGKDQVSVESIGRGTQDPHFIDAKPSYMAKVSRADLVVCIGLGLEDAWLNSVSSGARNPSVNPGQKGYLALGPKLRPEEIPQGALLSRSQGDVHPEGNPHVTLDPMRMADAAKLVATKLSELDPGNSARYRANAEEIATRLAKKSVIWAERVRKTGIKEVVTYHRTLDYFLKAMHLSLLTTLEPKPGIPPSVNHLSEVMSEMTARKATVVLIENFFNPDVAMKLGELNPAIRVSVVPVSVEGDAQVRSLDEVYENLVSTLERLSGKDSK